MAESLFETARRYVGPATSASARSLASEPPERVGRGFEQSVAATFAGFIHEASSDASLGRLHRALVTEGGERADYLAALPEVLADRTRAAERAQKGHALLGALFQGRLPDVVDYIAATSVVDRTSARDVLAIAASIVASVVGREVFSRKLGAEDLKRLLLAERSRVASALGPSGAEVFFGDDIGVEKPRAARLVDRKQILPANRAALDRMSVAKKPYDRSSRWLWIPLALIGLVVLLGLAVLVRGERAMAVTRPKAEIPRLEAPATPGEPAIPIDVPEVPEVEVAETPDNVEMPKVAEPEARPPEPGASAPPRATKPGERVPLGDGSSLDAALDDPNAPLRQRFVVSGFVFARDSHSNASDMAAAADAVAATMKEHPNARIRVDGYTDDRGTPDANRALALERAMMFRKELVDRGIPGERIAITGRGATEPIARNIDAEGRTENRRVEIVPLQR